MLEAVWLVYGRSAGLLRGSHAQCVLEVGPVSPHLVFCWASSSQEPFSSVVVSLTCIARALLDMHVRKA